MIVVTGAAGFIGSCLAHGLYRAGYKQLVLVDDFSKKIKAKNLFGLENCIKVDREGFFDWVDANYIELEFVLHIGARTDTTEFDEQIFEELNIKIEIKNQLTPVTHEYPDFKIKLIPFTAEYVSGELILKEHANSVLVNKKN